MRAGSPVLVLNLRGGFCDEIDIKYSGTRIVVTACIVDVSRDGGFVSRVSFVEFPTAKSACSVNRLPSLTQGEAIQMIPIREARDIATIRSERRVPCIGMRQTRNRRRDRQGFPP